MSCNTFERKYDQNWNSLQFQQQLPLAGEKAIHHRPAVIFQ
jgi:hypothetical protein